MNLDFVENLILRLCKQPRTFEFISQNLSGLDPLKTQEALKSLEKRHKIQMKDDLWVLKEKNRPPTLDLFAPDPHLYLKKYMGYFNFLKTPHPLDFEWRNSTASLNYLIGVVQELNNVNDNILFLGMPTLFATACIKDIPQKVTLVERNTQILKGLSTIITDQSRFKIIDADIFKVKPKDIGTYYCVMMDPPWYTPHFFQFMWLAAQCVDNGGIIGISLPPINTRPNISEERIEWYTFCQEQGLCLENLYSQKLHYAMPFFEFNALRAAGIENVFPFWRKGDLALFRKTENKKVERPQIEELKVSWIEKEFDTVRFRVNIKDDSELNSDIIIEHIIKGDILPTVSTRDERRKQANVWTSGNRIFRVSKPEKFVQILDNLIKNHPDNKDSKTVMDFIQYITEVEKKENNDYLDWLYHEMERQPN
jgi:hypothetical protein